MDVAKEVRVLKAMTVAELRDRYAEVFGEATTCGHKEYLWRRIAWRLQANAEGGLTNRARRRADTLANDADLRLYAPKKTVLPAANGHTVTGRLATSHDRRVPMPGSVLTREYKGQTLHVTVLDNGFEYEGEVYKSLSSIAGAVTGTHWNGFHFFGLAGGKEGQ
jgi:erythromycin esterase-like protein